MIKLLKNQIRNIIRKNYQNGTPERIRKEVKQAIEEYFKTKVEREVIDKLRKEIEKEFADEYVKSITGKSEYITDAKKIIRSASKQSDYLKDKLAKGIFEAIETVIENKTDWREIARENLRKLENSGIKIETELETHKAALDRLVRIKNLEETGWEYLEYAGPTGTVRPFCVEHIGRVYHIEEVKKMKNMFGQPALYYQGGYNCRHRWDPVEGRIIEKDEDGRIFAQKGFKETDGRK